MADEGPSVSPIDPTKRRLEFPAIEGRDELLSLFDAEQNFILRTDYYKDYFIKRLRLHALDFIQNLWDINELDAMIPYLAMTYFDQFMSKGEIPPVIQPNKYNTDLLLICCLTIAWKLRADDFELSNFLSGMEDRFTPKKLLKMELFICKRLNWRLQIVTPFTFVEPFIPILALPPDLPSPLRAASMLILKCQGDIIFTQFRPSVVATSALLTVISRMYPSHKVQCELNLLFSEFLTPLEDMVLLCNKKIAPLFRGIPMNNPSTVGRNQPDPIVDSDSDSDSDSEIVPVSVTDSESELMNFDLRWKEAIEDAEARRLAEGDYNDGCIISLVQKLVACWPFLARGLNVD